MKKRIIDLTDEDVERFLRKECFKYINNECYNCPLDIFGNCYFDVQEKIKEIVEVE